MTIKEITNLRKSGHLQEALEAANIEFSKNSNKYTAGALFWCLYDLLKQQSDGDAQETLERMKALYNDFCKGDEYMQKSLDSAEIQLETMLLHCINRLQVGTTMGLLTIDYIIHSVGLFITP